MLKDAEMRIDLESRGVKIVEKPPRTPQKPRLIKSTYYRYGESPRKDTVVQVTYSAWADYAARNAFYALSQNKYAAGVVEIVDTGNYGELCSVLTRDINGNIDTVFKRDPKRPKLVTDL